MEEIQIVDKIVRDAESCTPDKDSSDVTSDLSYLSNEKVLFVINTRTGVSPYSYEFIPGGRDPQLLSGFVSAMSSFMGEILESDQEHWKTESGSDSTLLVEGGNWAVGVLAVRRETNEARSKLRQVVREFEDSFEHLKDEQGIRMDTFKEFDKFVMRLFIDDRLSDKTKLIIGKDWKKAFRRSNLPSENYRIVKFLIQAENQQSIGELAKAQNLSLSETKDLVATAIWKNALYLHYVPSEEDILSLTEGTASFLLRRSRTVDLSHSTLKVITSLDGRNTLSSHFEELGIKDRDCVSLELGNLINLGFIQKISLERRLVLVNGCVLKNFIEICGKAIGPEKTHELFQEGIHQGIDSLPWIGRIKCSENLEIYCNLETNMMPSDLDDMFEAIDFVINHLQQLLEKQNVHCMDAKSLEDVRRRCYDHWGSSLKDAIL
ncbi:MAG: hypothetical protein ACTSQZ_00055 [Candidatus Thorarchaeota archaeon]